MEKLTLYDEDDNEQLVPYSHLITGFILSKQHDRICMACLTFIPRFHHYIINGTGLTYYEQIDDETWFALWTEYKKQLLCNTGIDIVQGKLVHPKVNMY